MSVEASRKSSNQEMASLTNFRQIIADEVHLLDSSGSSTTEVRDLFGTITSVALKRNIADSYTKTEVDGLIG